MYQYVTESAYVDFDTSFKQERNAKKHLKADVLENGQNGTEICTIMFLRALTSILPYVLPMDGTRR